MDANRVFCSPSLHVDEHSGLVEYGQVSLVGNVLDLVLLNIPTLKVLLCQVGKVGLAVVEIVLKPAK